MLRALIFCLLMTACSRVHTELAVMTKIKPTRLIAATLPAGAVGKTIVLCRQTDTM